MSAWSEGVRVRVRVRESAEERGVQTHGSSVIDLCVTRCVRRSRGFEENEPGNGSGQRN